MSAINSNPFASTNPPATAVPPGAVPTDSTQNSYDTQSLDERSSEELNADADRFSSLINDRAESREPVARQQDSRDGGGGESDSSQSDQSGGDAGGSFRSGTGTSETPQESLAFRGELSAPSAEVASGNELYDSDQADADVSPVESEFSGQAILQSMALQPAQAATTLNAPAVASTTPAATTLDAAQAVDALATQIADRILVSEPGMSGTDEVRILLKDSVLPQTEVRFSRDGGTLQVEFVTQSEASFDLLQGHQNALQDRLARKTDQPIKVAVTQSGQQDASGDGRSRQRQEVELDASSSKPAAK